MSTICVPQIDFVMLFMQNDWLYSEGLPSVQILVNNANNEVVEDVSHMLILKLLTDYSQSIYRTVNFQCGLRRRFVVGT